MTLEMPITIIFIIILSIALIFWFLKSKTRLRKMIVILTGLALVLFGYILNQIDIYNSNKDLVLNQEDLDSVQRNELMSNLNFDLGLIIYSVLLGLAIISIVYLEVHHKKVLQQRV
ncbi:hypothetical protein [uncultured Psychroserpens sp.]|uniref:hypothetical protein n=1 Tax=uncultured Psychroserpens sp. TaxID=255436 RepID=UPI002603FB17|nr:hypothetical protein [uncultured Psychroserpens sp.]